MELVIAGIVEIFAIQLKLKSPVGLYTPLEVTAVLFILYFAALRAFWFY